MVAIVCAECSGVVGPARSPWLWVGVSRCPKVTEEETPRPPFADPRWVATLSSPEKGLSVGCALCCDHTPGGGNNGLSKNFLGKRALEGKVWCLPPWGEG